MCHMCAKGLLDLNFHKATVDKISIFHEIAPNFTYSQKSSSLKHNWNFLDQLFLPYKFHGKDMWGMYFFIFARCEPLMKRYIALGLVPNNVSHNCFLIKIYFALFPLIFVPLHYLYHFLSEHHLLHLAM